MSSISVEENVTKMTDTLDKMRGQLVGQEREMYRLEGMLTVFRNLKDLGVTEIPVKPPARSLETIPDNEVLDETPVVPEK
jgi:hypothetical protein